MHRLQEGCNTETNVSIIGWMRTMKTKHVQRKNDAMPRQVRPMRHYPRVQIVPTGQECFQSVVAQVGPTLPFPCLSCCGALPPSILSSFGFPFWFSGCVLGDRRCAVATSSIRGGSRGGCAASPCSGKGSPNHGLDSGTGRRPSCVDDYDVWCGISGISVCITLLLPFGVFLVPLRSR